MTHSYARIVFVLGAPSSAMVSDPVNAAEPDIFRWLCGCQCAGPNRAMVWKSCAEHVHYTAVLNEERTSTLLAVRADLAHRLAHRHNRWSFDPANAFHARELRSAYLSILYAGGTRSSNFFAAELIYRELIGNALRHAPGMVDVELQWSDTYPILSVDDSSGLFFWPDDLPANSLSERGRGLFLVKSFARELRIKDSLGSGSKICAVLPVARNDINVHS